MEKNNRESLIKNQLHSLNYLMDNNELDNMVYIIKTYLKYWDNKGDIEMTNYYKMILKWV